VSQQAQPPSLVYYSSESEFKNHFCRVYCDLNNPIYTCDSIRVSFFPNQFNHAFRESANRAMRDKSIFSSKRAERIDWIKWALQCRNADLFKGWDIDKRCIDPNRRVCVVAINYIVIIQVETSLQRALFITAFVAVPETLRQIRNKPRW